MDEAPKKPHQADMLLASSIPRLEPTYVRGFDEILGGGLARGALMILAGPPGSGKTILATEMAFHSATHGQHALVFSAYSEPSNKLLTHLRNLTFFQPEEIGRTIEFLNVQQFLKEGLNETIEEIARAARRRRAAFVVLDSFASLRDIAGSAFESRKFTYEVGNRLNMLGATAVITSEANAHESYFFPEATTADVVVNLRYDTYGVRARRNIEVIKVRGAAPLIGLHAMSIDQHGVWIIPRIEARVVLAMAAQVSQQAKLEHTSDSTLPPPVGADVPPSNLPPPRVSTGLPMLDKRLSGGLVSNTTTLVEGTLGAGKTTFGLHFALAGLRAQEATLFLSLRDSTERILLHASGFSWGPELTAAHQAGRLALISLLPIEMRVDLVVEHLISHLEAQQIRRLVIDGINELEHGISANGYEDRLHDFCAALLYAIQIRGITTLLLRDTPEVLQSALIFPNGPMSRLVENVIWLRQELHGGQLVHILAIPQTRFSAHTAQSVHYTIEASEGMRIAETARLSLPPETQSAPSAGAADQ
jgi:circadian clock protein KaiC